MTQRYKPDCFYYIDGASLNGLLAVASLMSSGDRMGPDKRRDMAQWIQARLDNLEVVPDEKA